MDNSLECPVGRWSSSDEDSCSNACPAGKYGIRSGQSNELSACTPVKDGFYMSSTLSAPVACSCNNRGTCNKLTGVCECTGGWESSSQCNTCDVKAWNSADGSCSACTSTHEAWPSKGSNFKCLAKCESSDYRSDTSETCVQASWKFAMQIAGMVTGAVSVLVLVYKLLLFMEL
jgi:hypothetical protein